MQNQAGHQWENRYLTSTANYTSPHSTFHCGQHPRRRGGGGRKMGKKKHWKWEHLDLPEIPPTARTQDAHRPQAKHTPWRCLVSPFQKQCGSLLSPLQQGESPLYAATLQQWCLHRKRRELGPLAPLHEGAQSPTSRRKAPAMRRLSSADARSQCSPSDTSHVV